jgi:predicted ATPase/tetratricopeptide (TPR) repeat protein
VFGDGGSQIQAQLPQELNSFIGRERELQELRRLVVTTRALTLCGPGGIGKTRLALRLLALAASEFPDGACFVDLADLRQPDLVVPRVAAAAGISEEPGRPLADTLADALRSRRLLLALDNCEHLIGPCAQLCRRILASSPSVTLVLTSREPLRVPGETIWPVPPLSVMPPRTGTGSGSGKPEHNEAVRLFADRAAASRPGFAVTPDNAATVLSICQALDGLPLAIELAAARVRMLSAEQISARLGDRLELLTGGDRSASPRQHTLRATIEWSYEMLTGPEQEIFRRISVFAGWSLEMAEQVCADSAIRPEAVHGLMAALADKSLVVVEPELAGQARFRMLDTIREYATARLAETGQAAVFQRALRDYMLRTAEQYLAIGMAQVPVPWPVRVECSRRYDADSGNVSQVLGWCLAHGDVEAGLRICVAVSPRWMVRSTIAQGCEWLDSFQALDCSAVPARVRGPALVVRAQLALSTDLALAQDLAVEGFALCRDAGDEFWTAGALNILSEAALQAGLTSQAVAYADQALAVAQAAGDGWSEGFALGTRAAAAAREGKPREAEQLASASLRVMRHIDQQWGAARALLGLGDLARLRGHAGEAHSRYVEALPILREIGARPEIARCLAGLGRVSMDLGAIEQARRHLTRSIQLSREAGLRAGVARGLEAFAALAVHENRPELAVQLAAAAATLRTAAGLPPLPAARTETYLAPARHLGPATVARLWAQGLNLSTDTAVTLAVDRPSTAAPEDNHRALTPVAGQAEPASPASSRPGTGKSPH